MQGGFVNSTAYSEYAPFGIIFDKKWIFDQGGRPVIYGPDSEFNLLPDTLKWRHVRYEPGKIDFTWQREWRVQCDNLPISTEIAAVLLPSQEWVDLFIKDHDLDQDIRVFHYETAIDAELAETFREPFNWKIVVLNSS